MTNNTKNIYYECCAVVSVASFWINSAGFFGEFHVVFEHFERKGDCILKKKNLFSSGFFLPY